MKLRGKTLSFVTLTLCVLLIVLYTASKFVLFRGFDYVERENTRKNINQMIDAFKENSSNLSVKCADWSKWDDDYAFIKDGNKGFIESNLNDGSLCDLKLNFMCFISTINEKPEIRFLRGFNLANSTGYEPSEVMRKWFLSENQWVHFKDQEGVTTGIVMSPEGPLTIGARPIVKSSGEGPIRGSVIFARRLDSAEINRIANITHLSLSVLPCTSKTLPRDMRAALPLFAPGIQVAMKPLSSDTVAGYSQLSDIHGKPLLLARVALYRAIYKQGIKTLWYLMGAILLAGFIFGLTILLVLEKLVLSRIAYLNGDVSLIGKSGDHSKRVLVSGNDELSNLAIAMNSTFGALQKVETEIRKIMNTVPSGLLSLDENFIIKPEYSKSVEDILEKQGLASINFFDCIGITRDRPGDRKKLFDFLDTLRQEILPEKEMAGLNPFEELQLTAMYGKKKWVRLRYFLMAKENAKLKDFLVVIEDITEEKQLAEKVRQSERENLQLKAIIEDPDLFRDFLFETQRIIQHAEEQLDSLGITEDRKNCINEIYRDVHTVKGTASSFGLTAVAEISGSLESALNPLRDSGTISTEMIKSARGSIVLLARTVMEAVENAKKILGDEFDDETDIHLKVSLVKLKGEAIAIHELISKQLVEPKLAKILSDQINDKMNSLRMVPSRRGLAKTLRIIPRLITRLSKNINFEFEGADVLMDCETARELNTPLIHLIRNACDHGIEIDPDDRLVRGKSAEGHVKLSVRQAHNALKVEVLDDGNGIDAEHIKKVAVRKGLISQKEADKMPDDQAIQLIYKPGFSTVDDVTDVSGRGVGMDAVISSVRDRLKGTVTISTVPGKGATFVLTVPF